MANKNDYNYYKNEYGKYKDNYYSPGSEEYKKRKNNSRKQKVARFFRAFVVFLIISCVVVAIVFGIIKLSSVIREKVENNKPETTTEITTVEDKTTNQSDNSPYKKGTKCIVETPEGTGVYLRNKPTYDVSGYQLVEDGKTVIIEEVSEDGEWARTSNFDNNGWLYLKYLKIVNEESTTETKPTEKETTTKAEETTKETTTKAEKPTENKTQLDSSINTYADAIEAFKEKGSGAVMNCKIVGSGAIYATSKPAEGSTKILYLVPGESVKVVRVDGGYSKIIKAGYESSVTWVPNENLSFVSWG